MSVTPADKRRNIGFPIVVGIVGHRDPAHPDLVDSCIRDGFRQIAARWPQSDIVGLSPLADGVDRIFARALLEAGHRLRVILPMPAERYKQDFDAASQAEFDTLCVQAELITQAPPVSGMLPEDDPRVADYLSAGFYIAQASHILFAGWDGYANGLQAGTGHIVHARLTGIYDRIADMDVTPKRFEDDVCPASHMTYVIRTERQNASQGHALFSAETDAVWGVSPRMLGEGTHRHRLSDFPRTEALDRMVRMGQRLKITALTDRDTGTDGLQLLETLRQAVEHNANRYITRERSRLPILLALAIAAVTSFAVYGDFFDLIPHSWLLLIVYALSLIGIAFLTRSQSKRVTASDPTGWRRLAEALRVVIAWHRAGIGVHWDDLRPGSEFRLTRRDDWVDCALRGHLIGYQDMHGPEGGIRDLQGLETGWVDEQIAYFRGKDSQSERLNTLRKLGGAALVIGLLCIVALGYFDLIGATESLAARLVWFMTGVFPATGALLTGYASVLEQNSPASERQRMLLMFLELKQRLEAFRSEETPTANQRLRLRKAILSLGRYALDEVQNWSQLTNDAISKAKEFGR